MKSFRTLGELSKRDIETRSEHTRWENVVDKLAQCRVATNLQFVRNTRSVKCREVKLHKSMCARTCRIVLIVQPFAEFTSSTWRLIHETQTTTGSFSDMKHQGLYPDWKPLLASWWVEDLGSSPARWDSERQGISEASVLLTSMASLVCHWGESLSCWVECSGPVPASLRLSWPWSNSCTASNYQVSSNFSFLICKMEFILFFVSIKIK